MRRKELEILLQKIPPNPKPKVKLEQYATPAGVAADILYEAYARDDIAGKRAVDLGCGTGIFAIGASILGAGEVTGVDIDAGAIKIAKKSALNLNAKVDFLSSDIRDFTGRFDTCFQNPPFGYQNKQLDRGFLYKALEIAGVVYTLHHAEAVPHVGRQISGKGSITYTQNYKFPIPYTYRFHTAKSKIVDVTLFRIQSLSIKG